MAQQDSANYEKMNEEYAPIKPKASNPQPTADRPFALKKWNAMAVWSWDVECDACAICRVPLMEECLRCQTEKSSDCVVVWGECNHSFHNCCMSQWTRQSNRCPLCQQEWAVNRTGN